MSQPCPECGAAITPTAPAGLCPRCLFALSLRGEAPREPGAPDDPPQTQPTPPLLCRLGDYELLEEIGRGGMGVVYRARQISLKRIVAVKVLPAAQFADASTRERFQSEAQMAASLRHPHIVAIFETGQEQGCPYFAMEYVEGWTLDELLRRQPLSARQAAGYVERIALAIQHAHERGILHRDLKPSNVLIDENDQPRVTDFGLARHLEGTLHATVTGALLGSPNYMPPEQAGGRRGEPGPRSDIYSLGAILYHLLTGRPPFHAGNIAETLHHLAHTEPVSPRLLNPGVPRDLETICLKCLEKEPAKRYASAQELADELGRFLKDEPIHARPVSRAEKVWRWCRRKPALAGSFSALALALSLGFVGVLTQWQRAERHRQRAEDNAANERRERYYSSIAAADSHIRNGDIDLALGILTNCPAEFRHWEWGRLVFLCHQSISTIQLTTNNAESLVVSADGSRAASARLVFSAGGRAACWEVGTRRELFRFGSSSNAVVAMAFSPDGRQIAMARLNGQVRIWDADTGREGVEFSASNQVVSMQFSVDGTRLALSTSDQRSSLWDASGRLLQAAPAPDVECRASAMDPMGRYWATLDAAGGLTLRDARTGESRFVMQGFADRNPTTYSKRPTLIFSPDGEHLLAHVSPRAAKVWSTENGRELLSIPTRVYAAAFSSDGRLLATISGNKTAEVWDLANGEKALTLQGHEAPLNFVGFDQEGRWLFTASSDGVLKTWSTRLGQEVLWHPYPVDAVAFSPDRRRLITTQLDGIARIWETSSGREALAFRGNWNWLRAASFSPDGKRIVTGGADRLARIFDAATGRELLVMKGHASGIRSAVFSPDGRRVATGSWDKTAKLWDAETGEELFTLDVHSGSVRFVAFAPNGKWLVTLAHDSEAHVWETGTGRHLFALAGGSSQLSALAVSSDGHSIATGSWSGSIRLWDAKSGRNLARWKTRSRVQDVAFSPDGKRLVAASSENTGTFAYPAIEIWDVETGRHVIALQDHNSLVMSVKFSPDGRRLATGSVDGTARIREAFPWDERAYSGSPGASLLDRVRAYAESYWRERLALEAPAGAASQKLDLTGAARFAATAWLPRERGLSSNQIDLSAQYNGLLNVPWQLVLLEAEYDNDLSNLPIGSVTFSNVTFDVRGLIRLQAASSAWAEVETNSFPVAVRGIRVGARCRQLHLLHGANGAAPEGTVICRYVLHYADGSEREIPIGYGQDVRGWWQQDDDAKESDRGVVAWRGTNPAAENHRARLRLYLSTFENPQPGLELTAIDIVSTLARSGSFLVALTIEP